MEEWQKRRLGEEIERGRGEEGKGVLRRRYRWRKGEVDNGSGINEERRGREVQREGGEGKLRVKERATEIKAVRETE